MAVETISQDGRERIVMDRGDYDELVDAKDHAIAMRDIANGAETLTSAEMDDYLAAVTPLAFWRRRAGKTQAELAAETGVSQPFLAQLENGKRQGGLNVVVRLARALRVRVEDLVPDV
jgi:DNA-binding XRE family transcriptional regulator